MSASQFGTFTLQVIAPTGTPAEAYRLYTYATGTTTHKDVYTDAAGTTPHTYTSDGAGGQFIALDSRGELPAPMYAAAGAYDLTLKTAAGASVWTRRADPASGDTALRSDLASTASTAVGDALIGVKLPSVTGARDKTQHGKNAETLHLSDVAVGDGTTDNTTVINALFDYAATNGCVVYVDAGTYLFDGLLIVKNGMRGLIGKGGTLKVAGTITAVSGVILAGPTAGETRVADCDIRGLTIDCNNAGNGTTTNTVGIWGQNTLRCNVIGNRVLNVKYGHGVLLRQYSGSTDGGSNVIAYNFVQGELLNEVASAANWYGIGCDMEPIYNPTYTDAGTQWKALFLGPNNAARIAATSSAYQDGNKVIGNRVIGGYYGLSLQSLTNSVVALNSLYGNQRGISLQNNASGNEVSANIIQECFSSGLTMGYGSSNNAIRGNRVSTTVGGGEGLLQGYLGCKDNIVEDNDIYCSSAGNQYHVYFGVHASGNIVRKNKCRGTALRAYIAVESSWNTSDTDPATYGYNKVFTNGVANEATTAVVVGDNFIDGSSAVPALFLGQINDGTAWALTDIELCDNRVKNSSHSHQLKLKEDTASNLNSLRLTGNRFNLSAGLSQFTFPRGRGHFALQRDNDVVNIPGAASGFYSFTDADTTPSVGVADTWACANTGATSITMFDDGVDMQIIEIKGDANTTLVHDNTKIRLKGAVNAALGSANSMIVLRRHAGIWFELTRNF